MVQYTNRGVGTTSLTLRINCPPEITVVTLQATADQQTAARKNGASG
jgi:hypothetical protein